MLRFLLTLFAFVFTAGVTFAQPAANQTLDCSTSGQLKNPSFELVSSNRPRDWTYSGGGNGSFTRSNGYQKCGNYYGLLTSNKSGDYKAYQDVNLSEGDKVTLSVWAGIHESAGSNTRGQFIKLHFLKSNGTVILSVTRRVTNNVSNGGMRRYELSGTAPAGAKKVRVEGSISTTTSSVRYLKMEMASLIIEDSSLPVVLATLDARTEGADAVVSWSTTEEINAQRFEINHSRNGSDWNVVGQVEATGNHTGLKSYSFVHNNPSNGTNFYRLRTVDLDGSSELSRIVSLNYLSVERKPYLYPNPSFGLVTVKTAEEVKGLTVYNVLGKEVFRSNGKVEGDVNLSHLPAGNYLVQLQDGDGAITTQRIQIRN